MKEGEVSMRSRPSSYVEKEDCQHADHHNGTLPMDRNGSMQKRSVSTSVADIRPILLLPAAVTIEEIESHLDRIAMAATANPRCHEYLAWYGWLEGQLAAKRQQLAVLSSISDRIRRLRDRMEAPSSRER